MEGTLRRVRSPPAALWTETLDNLWRINSSLRSFSLWARHSAETSAELNVRSVRRNFSPWPAGRCEGEEAAEGRKCEGGAERLRVESRVHDTNLRSVGEQNRCQVGPTILFECPAQIPRSFLRSFSLWATPGSYRHDKPCDSRDSISPSFDTYTNVLNDLTAIFRPIAVFMRVPCG